MARGPGHRSRRVASSRMRAAEPSSSLPDSWIKRTAAARLHDPKVEQHVMGISLLSQSILQHRGARGVRFVRDDAEPWCCRRQTVFLCQAQALVRPWRAAFLHPSTEGDKHEGKRGRACKR